MPFRSQSVRSNECTSVFWNCIFSETSKDAIDTQTIVHIRAPIEMAARLRQKLFTGLAHTTMTSMTSMTRTIWNAKYPPK